MDKAKPAGTEGVKVLVIGGSGNLGTEICRKLAAMGFELGFTYYQHKEKAETMKQELESQGVTAYALPCDLSQLGSITDAVDGANAALGGIDALIVSSGIATGQTWQGKQPDFFQITSDGYDKMMTINVRGVFFLCQHVARIMKENQKGRMVIIGSIDGLKPVPAPVDYACCKSALWGLTQALSKELGKYNILVNMVAPGILEGGIAEKLSPELMQEYLKHCALRRVGKFSELANAATFLAGPRNTYMTGQALILDGCL